MTSGHRAGPESTVETDRTVRALIVAKATCNTFAIHAALPAPGQSPSFRYSLGVVIPRTDFSRTTLSVILARRPGLTSTEETDFTIWAIDVFLALRNGNALVSITDIVGRTIHIDSTFGGRHAALIDTLKTGLTVTVRLALRCSNALSRTAHLSISAVRILPTARVPHSDLPGRLDRARTHHLHDIQRRIDRHHQLRSSGRLGNHHRFGNHCPGRGRRYTFLPAHNRRRRYNLVEGHRARPGKSRRWHIEHRFRMGAGARRRSPRRLHRAHNHRRQDMRHTDHRAHTGDPPHMGSRNNRSHNLRFDRWRQAHNPHLADTLGASHPDTVHHRRSAHIHLPDNRAYRARSNNFGPPGSSEHPRRRQAASRQEYTLH